MPVPCNRPYGRGLNRCLSHNRPPCLSQDWPPEPQADHLNSMPVPEFGHLNSMPVPEFGSVSYTHLTLPTILRV